MRKKISLIIIFSLVISVFAPSVYLKENNDYSLPSSTFGSYTGKENSHVEVGYKEADAWVVLVGRLVIQGTTRLAKVGSKTFKKVPSSTVTNALKNYKGTTYSIGSKKYKLTKTDMKHMLERHHPKYWTDNKKNVKKQTFFDYRLSIKDIENIAISVAKQNREKLSKVSSNGSAQVKGKVDGVEYVLGVEKGHIRQLYPVAK
ncbi:EndoU domain-containing protein [Bacillus sp. FJAT-52991]|uniref:Bacterial EndoU nuclease domain-containing protein n=1 Tax=Bacillus kandeliae TaxID=3129297 RepID=A0ABZ2N4T7_9BACI